MWLAQSPTWPMVMRHHFPQRDVVLVHEIGSQLSGPLDSCRPAVAAVLTHLNSNGIVVTWTIEVGMLTLFIGWKVLHNTILIHRKVPDEITNAVSTATLSCAQFTVLQGH